MNNDNAEQLKKLAKVFNTDNIITPREIESVLTAITKILASFKKQNQELNDETKAVLNVLFDKISEEHNRSLQALSDKNDKTLEEVSKSKKDIDSKITKALSKLEQTVQDVLAMKPVDGKDADEEKIVEDVLSKIILPEYKETVLDGGEEIVDKINSLSIEPENQIDASHIKNLPTFSGGKFGKAGTRYLKDLVDVNLNGLTQDSDGKYELGSGGGGSSTFLDLTDTPSDYTGQAGKFPKVNAGEDALEFVSIPGGGDMLASTYDPTSVSGDAFDMDNMVEGTTNKILTATERSEISANTAKVTNATHTGQVTGATTLTLNKRAIGDQTDTAITADDKILFADADDDSNLKKDTVQGILDLAGDALTSNPLSQFASTTSSELAGVISDETGSGALVFATSPTLTTPTIGTINSLVAGSDAGNVLSANVTGNHELSLTNSNTGGSTTSSFIMRQGGNNRFQLRYSRSTLDTELSTFSASSDLVFSPNSTGVLRIAPAGLTVTGTLNTHTIPGGTGTLALTSQIPTISDTAYDSTSWNANTDGASKNAIRDKIDAMDTTISGKLDSSSYDDADSSETNTGTSTAKYVSPDALAGSVFGTKEVIIPVFLYDYVVTTGDGKVYVTLPSTLNGMDLVGVRANLGSAPSTSGTPTVQIARGRRASATSALSFVDVLSTPITVDANEYDSKDATTPAVINTSNDDIATGDVYRVDVDVAGTGAKGLDIICLFRLP